MLLSILYLEIIVQDFVVNNVLEQGSQNRTLPNASSDPEGVHTRVGVIQQGTFCQIAGDNSTKVKRHILFKKRYYDVIPPGRVKGIPNVQDVNRTRALDTPAVADCCVSHVWRTTGGRDSRQTPDKLN